MTDDAATAREFLVRQRVARLASVDESGAPHVVPVCFALIEQTLYIAIDEKPKRVGREVRRLQRLRNIAAEPRVALVADVYDDADWGRLGWVMARGTARVLEEGQEHAAALAALRGKYAQYAAMALEGRPVIALAIERLTAWGELDT